MLSVLLLLLYPIAIQYEVRRWPIKYLYWFTGLVDIVANYTELVLLTMDFPEQGEYTFSKRLFRLQTGNWFNRLWARAVIPYLNYFQPSHVPKPP